MLLHNRGKQAPCPEAGFVLLVPVPLQETENILANSSRKGFNTRNKVLAKSLEFLGLYRICGTETKSITVEVATK